ncbi:translation initiation factor IF-2 subunit gamma [Candidatus Pacearchaeota archaeon]|nr:translation initiation factor IF-2 subunit gamma [Candidatus Pacearchaeota archaeon]|tara:strand:- start:1708 stop:2916 length:1209 start_codon:yes stop_codon:yes gene_type:complete
MAEKKINYEKLEGINVVIVGHIDHGKTTLLERLSGKWASQHSEELKRGITIKLGYADAVIYEDKGEYNISGEGKSVKHVSFVDAPGHEMLMATMLSGAAMVDAAVLVIAANEGIKPQTREHLMALKAKGVKQLIVVQNKIDLVDKKEAEKNHNDILELLKKNYGTGEIPIIPVSAQQGVNISEVLKSIVNLSLIERKLDCDPVFIVARSFDVNKPGTEVEKLSGAVLGGTLKCGKLKVGDEIEIKPGRVVKEANKVRYETVKTKVVGLFLGSQKVSTLGPGGSAGIETELDMALGARDILSGNVVSLSGKLPDLSSEIKLKFELFEEIYGVGGHVAVDPIKASETLMLSINTETTGGNVKRLKGAELEMNLKVPAIVFKGDNVGIARNINSHWRLIGWGEVL